MSIETEVKAAEIAVEGEAKKVEGAVETKIEEIEKAVEGTIAATEGEVKTVAGEVEKETKQAVAEVKEVAPKVEEKVKAAIVDIATEEKLFLREAELEYLKAQMEIQRLQKITETKSKEYQAYIQSLLNKYALSKAEYIFDATVNAFKKL